MSAHPYRLPTAMRPAVSQRMATSQRGLSLIEVMVSLAIGLVVIGAVFANYLNNSRGSRETTALTQVTNDATLAFGILRNHIAMADYSQPSGIDAKGNMIRRLAGRNLFGCSGGFDSTTDSSSNVDNITCAAANKAGTSDAMLIRYEVDMQSVPSVTDATTKVVAPMDCAGSGLADLGTAGAPYYVADNRFLIASGTSGAPSLSCLGSGNLNGGAQALVENIQEMHLLYGVAQADINGKPGAIQRYVSASDMAATDWANVVAVRICLLVRSNDEVLNAKTPYRDCAQSVVDGVKKAIPDRRIYRAFTSTVVLNNRVNPDPNAVLATSGTGGNSGTETTDSGSTTPTTTTPAQP
jgi:type IV pilus assembly protein PilW